MFTPLTPIVQDAAGVVGGVWVRDKEGAVVGDGDGDGVGAIAGAGVVVEATPPSTCVLVHASVRVGVLDTPTIPFSGARTFPGRLGSSALSSGRLGGGACCWGWGVVVLLVVVVWLLLLLLLLLLYFVVCCCYVVLLSSYCCWFGCWFCCWFWCSWLCCRGCL